MTYKKKIKLFIIEIGCFISIMIFCFLLLDSFYTGYKVSIDYLNEKIESTKLRSSHLLIGNSHMGSINQKEWQDNNNYCNLSIGGQDLFHEYILIKSCIKRMPNLKSIIINVDYDQLGYNLVKTANQAYTDREYYAIFNEMYDSSFSNKLISSSFFFRANRDLSYLTQPSNTNKKETINFIPVSHAINEKACKQRALEHSIIKFDSNLCKENTKILNQIAFICKKNRIKLSLINLPKRKCYEESLDFTNITLAKQVLYDFTIQNNIVFVDFFNSNLFNNDDFIDPDHLNYVGGKKVIDILEKKNLL